MQHIVLLFIRKKNNNKDFTYKYFLYIYNINLIALKKLSKMLIQCTYFSINNKTPYNSKF